MLDQTSIRPYRKGDAIALAEFLEGATFLVGDDDFTPKGTHLLYFLYSERLKVIGIFEIEVAAIRHLGGDEPSLGLSKLALLEGFVEEEYVRSVLLFLIKEANRLNAGSLFLLGEELPFEREAGFVPAAPKGIYLAEDPEANIPNLRIKRLQAPDAFNPGILYRF